MTASDPALFATHDRFGAVELGDARPLSSWLSRLGGEAGSNLHGVPVRRVVEPGLGTDASDVSVVAEARWLAAARTSRETVVVTPKLVPELPATRCWRHAQPLWVLSQLLQTSQIEHDCSWLDPSEYAERFAGVHIGPGCRIAVGAQLAPGVQLAPNVVIYDRVWLGARVQVGAGSVVGRPGFGWTLAPDGQRTRVPQLGGVRLGSDAELGPLCTIDAGTLRPTFVGQRTKLDAQVHVGHNGRIGDDCMIAAQSGLAGSVILEAGVWIGGQVGIADHVRVGAGARIAAGSGVIGPVPAGAVFAGYPAVERRRWLRGMARALPGRRGRSGRARLE